MLSEKEKHEIEAEIPNYAQKQAVCIDALKIVQRYHGWVSDEAIKDLAQFLEMSPAELDAVATFYNLIYREPVGRHVILTCNSISCWVMGFERVSAYMQKALGIGLGETSSDGRFTLLPNVCMGICDYAPAMMIDDDTYTNLDEAKIDSILARYL
ncbi:MAG TPA: NADH-quinone oxidoreductase subunit NuoE [Anaerolineaceae bacterium]|jgi:NADH-quinone oxidoreductase subunit E